LLTTTVTVKTDYKNIYNTPKARLKIYIDSINDWLKYTDLTIYVVESSNYDFPEYRNNPRVNVCSFKSNINIKCNRCDATPYEAESILTAFDYFNLNKYDNIIKVTGKYFIPNIKTILNDIPPDAELILQNTYSVNCQNSEIFGCKTKYLIEIMNKILENSRKNINFEKTLYDVSSNYKVYRLPPIKLTKPIQRSGDNKLMFYL
jgi:hypothetical protein